MLKFKEIILIVTLGGIFLVGEAALITAVVNKAPSTITVLGSVGLFMGCLLAGLLFSNKKDQFRNS